MHRVEITRRFAIGKYEVTFEEYDVFAKETGKRLPDDNGWGRGDRPVIDVSWEDAVAYAEWLSQKTRKTYRLPTEAEWEYAARAGIATRYWWGDDIGRNNANCDGCGSRWDNKQTAPVGSFQANAFGLHDTAGNVWEWTQDWYGAYSSEAQTNPQGPGTGSRRVARGGSWNDSARYCRSAYRDWNYPSYRISNLGFRLARHIP